MVGVSLSQFRTSVFATFSPISSPITSPISSATVTLSGWVKYLNHYRFVPAEGAQVMAKNKKTNEVFSTTTSSDGKYSLAVPKGKYSVLVTGTGNFSNFKFLPKLNNLPLLFNLKMNFFGLPNH